MNPVSSTRIKLQQTGQCHFHLLLGGCLGFLVGLSSAFATSFEDKLKATYIARFTEFIEWPTSSDNSPFKICILGEHPIEVPLQKLPALITVKGHNLQVQRIDSIQSAMSCAIVFAAKNEASRMGALHQTVQNYPVLTIGDTPGLIAQNVLINFYFEGERLRFEINMQAVRESGLKVSSRLLKIAKIKD